MSPAAEKPDDAPRRRLHGEHFWHEATDPVFLLSRSRRLVYANPAWERLTGISFADARGRTCRRHGSPADPLEQVLSALAPPADAVRGQACQARRRAPGKRRAWWEIDFFPWADAPGPHAILGKIRDIAEAAAAHAVLPEKLVQLRERHVRCFGLQSWQGDAPVMQRLVAQLRLAAQTTGPVLFSGPAGSGKTWAARTVHQLSDRRGLSFATFDARLPAALLADLLASGPAARLGTLFIRHVERLPRDVQALLVERLDSERAEGEPRLMASTAADLDAEARGGRVLPELHFRMSVLTIQTPALRDRLPDLPSLVRDMLPRAADAAGRDTNGVTAAALDRLHQHDWDGNLRELHEVLFNACRRAQGAQIEVADLPFYLQGVPALPEKPLALDDTLAKVERRLIELALRISQGNKSAAASLLAIWRPRLLRRMEQLNLETSESSTDAAANPAEPPEQAEG